MSHAMEVRPLDDSFPRRYSATARGRFEAPDDLLFFPARPALIVGVAPDRGEPWSAAFGEYHHSALSAIHTTPDERTLCVVSGGAGYFVDTIEPDQAGSWLAIECVPVRIVLPFPKHGLLVVGKFTEFVAYRGDCHPIDVRLDVAWRSAQLGWDELEVTRTTDDRIEGRAWSAPEDEMIGYSVDVRTGAHEGGAFSRDADAQHGQQ